MKTKNLFFGAVEGVIWFAFIYYLLYAIKNPVELWQASLILLVLVYLGTISCPLVRSTDAWKRMFKDDKCD